jgi:hypothetical protein
MATSKFDRKHSKGVPKVKRNMLAAVTAVILSCTSATILAAGERTPDATLDLSGGSVAVGVGIGTHP